MSRWRLWATGNRLTLTRLFNFPNFLLIMNLRSSRFRSLILLTSCHGFIYSVVILLTSCHGFIYSVIIYVFRVVFNLSCWRELCLLQNHGNPTNHLPELILNNFTTRLGCRVGRYSSYTFVHVLLRVCSLQLIFLQI